MATSDTGTKMARLVYWMYENIGSDQTIEVLTRVRHPLLLSLFHTHVT